VPWTRERSKPVQGQWPAPGHGRHRCRVTRRTRSDHDGRPTHGRGPGLGGNRSCARVPKFRRGYSQSLAVTSFNSAGTYLEASHAEGPDSALAAGEPWATLGLVVSWRRPRRNSRLWLADVSHYTARRASNPVVIFSTRSFLEPESILGSRPRWPVALIGRRRAEVGVTVGHARSGHRSGRRGRGGGFW
jgi:hypothetical protein